MDELLAMGLDVSMYRHIDTSMDTSIAKQLEVGETDAAIEALVECAEQTEEWQRSE